MTDNKVKAMRFNEGKRKWSLVDFKSLEPMVEVLEFGERKYAAWNWKKGQAITELCESLLRHTFAFMDGEDEDPESHLLHIGHMMSNLMFMSYVLREKPEFDDRFNKQNVESNVNNQQ
jgi:hypothetical protein